MDGDGRNQKPHVEAERLVGMLGRDYKERRGVDVLKVSSVLFLALAVFGGITLHRRLQVAPFPYIPNKPPISEDAYIAYYCSSHQESCVLGRKMMVVRNEDDLRACVQANAPRVCIFAAVEDATRSKPLVITDSHLLLDAEFPPRITSGAHHCDDPNLADCSLDVIENYLAPLN